ncbi:MAG: ABC transporter permease, partial [Rhodospirillaceae bacterium]
MTVSHPQPSPKAPPMLLARLRAHPSAVAALAVLAGLAALALAAPFLEAALGVDAAGVNLLERFGEPSWSHPLGTDELGRDLLARLLEGGRVSLFVGVTAALTAALLGTAVGLPAGYF